ncbi:ribosomal protein S18 acetylase RimI-like enzyme [Lachnospiraceae bacterium PFB1-21]
MIRVMNEKDYEEVYRLWKRIEGFGMKKVDDSKEYVERFLRRNPTTSMVAVYDGKIVGSILCGHDGRVASFYHVCVDKHYRRRGIGRAMVVKAMEALKVEDITKVILLAYVRNDGGNAFWNGIGWTKREDLNCYDFILNTENIVAFNNEEE